MLLSCCHLHLHPLKIFHFTIITHLFFSTDITNIKCSAFVLPSWHISLFVVVLLLMCTNIWLSYLYHRNSEKQHSSKFTLFILFVQKTHNNMDTEKEDAISYKIIDYTHHRNLKAMIAEWGKTHAIQDD